MHNLAPIYGRLGVAVLLVGTLCPRAEAQIEVDPDQQYLLLATTRTGTMEEELDAAALLGFRVVSGAPTSGDEMVFFLERAVEPPDTYRYMLLATSRTSVKSRTVKRSRKSCSDRWIEATALKVAGMAGVGQCSYLAVLHHVESPYRPRPPGGPTTRTRTPPARPVSPSTAGRTDVPCPHHRRRPAGPGVSR